MKTAGKTDIGYRRSENQDKYITGRLDNKTTFGFVCDGMGGAKGGQVASDMMITHIEESLFLHENDTHFDDEQIVINAIDQANSEIYALSKSNENLNGMGTTITGFTIIGDNCRIYNIGDSRTYIYREGVLTQITEDHSVVQQLYKQGSIAKEDISKHPQKNLITRAVGVSDEVDVDMFTLTLQQDDILLSASDGLTNFVSEEQLTEILNKGEDIFTLPKNLIAKALDNKASDNITVAIVYNNSVGMEE